MFLGLDLGTTNVKAVLADAGGQVHARGAAEVRLMHRGDAVEQDIEDIWQATLSAIERTGDRDGLSRVRAIGVSSQGGAIQMLDGDDRPLGNVISWLDGRGKKWDEAITEKLGEDWFARHTGHGHSAVAVGELLRIREQRPEILQPPNKVGFVGDVIVGRLCGRRAHDPTSLSLPVLFNPRTAGPDEDLLERIGIETAQLPRLTAATEPAGTLRQEVADNTGLAPGIPVSPAVHDQYAAALGSGVVEPGEVMFGAGTAWVLLAVTDRLLPPVSRDAFACPHPVQGLYGQLLSLVTGGSALSWLTRVLNLDKEAPDGIDNLAETVPAGSDGLRFWPFLVAGGREGLDSKPDGCFRGLRLSHGQPHLLRAVLEGLCMELRRYLGFFTGAGLEVTRLIMNGGATTSRITPQILADATKLPVDCSAQPDASALGGAVLAHALVASGQSLADISRRMAPEVKTFEPGPETRTYEEVFDEYSQWLGEN